LGWAGVAVVFGVAGLLPLLPTWAQDEPAKPAQEPARAEPARRAEEAEAKARVGQRQAVLEDDRDRDELKKMQAEIEELRARLRDAEARLKKAQEKAASKQGEPRKEHFTIIIEGPDGKVIRKE